MACSSCLVTGSWVGDAMRVPLLRPWAEPGNFDRSKPCSSQITLKHPIRPLIPHRPSSPAASLPSFPS